MFWAVAVRFVVENVVALNKTLYDSLFRIFGFFPVSNEKQNVFAGTNGSKVWQAQVTFSVNLVALSVKMRVEERKTGWKD